MIKTLLSKALTLFFYFGQDNQKHITIRFILFPSYHEEIETMLKNNDEDLLTLEEAAEYSHFKIGYLYKMSHENRFRKYNIRGGGRQVFVKRKEFLEFLSGTVIKSRDEIIEEEKAKAKAEVQEVIQKKIKKYEKKKPAQDGSTGDASQ